MARSSYLSPESRCKRRITRGLIPVAALCALLSLIGCSGISSENSQPSNGGGQNPPPQFLRAPLGDSGQYAVYYLDPNSGALNPVPDSPFGINDGTRSIQIAIAGGKFLYGEEAFGSGSAAYDDIVTYSINGQSGALSEVTGAPVMYPSEAETPGMTYQVLVTGMAADPSGKLLYVAVDGGGVIVYSINPGNGNLTLASIPASTQTTGSEGPLAVASIAVHPSGKFLYTLSVDGSVYGYTVDLASGVLTAIPQSPIASGPQMTTFPYWDPDEYLTMDPEGRFLFVANVGVDEWGLGGSSSVSAFTIDSSTGALTRVAGSPFTTGGLPLAVTTDSSGKFLYVADNSSSTVWAYEVEPAGSLQTVAGSPFPVITLPVWIGIDQTSHFLFVSDGQSITSYSINKSTGAMLPTQNSPAPGGQFVLMSAN